MTKRKGYIKPSLLCQNAVTKLNCPVKYYQEFRKNYGTFLFDRAGFLDLTSGLNKWVYKI